MLNQLSYFVTADSKSLRINIISLSLSCYLGFLRVKRLQQKKVWPINSGHSMPVAKLSAVVVCRVLRATSREQQERNSRFLIPFICDRSWGEVLSNHDMY